MSKQYDKWVIGVNTITNLKMFEYTNNSDILLFSRDETIRSSHDTIRIDTKGGDMIINDTIRYNTGS